MVLRPSPAIAWMVVVGSLLPATHAGMPAAPMADVPRDASELVTHWPGMRAFLDALSMASQLGFTPTRQATASDGWPTLSSAGYGLELYALGDVSDDGLDDVLAIQTVQPRPQDATSVSGRIDARLGPQLATSTWGFATHGESATTPGDFDGDHIDDILLESWGSTEIAYTNEDIVASQASNGKERLQWDQAFRRGTSGTVALSKPASNSYESTEASTRHVVGYSGNVALEATTRTAIRTIPLGNGTFARVEQRLVDDVVVVSTLAGAAHAYGGPSTLMVDFLDAAGTTQGTAATAGPFDNVVGVAFAPMDPVAGDDLLVTILEDPVAYSLVAPNLVLSGSGQGSYVRVEAWAGSDGHLLWSKRLDPAAGYVRAAIALPVGDLDADGTSDVELLDFVLTPPVSIEEHVELLSGRDGSTLKALDTAGRLLVLLPFGDIHADGRDEMWGLDVTLNAFAGTAAYEMGVYNVNLDAVWTWTPDVTQGLRLANALVKQPGGPPAGLADWTGDGKPDLVLASVGPEPDAGDEASREFVAEVRDGTSGQVALGFRFTDTYLWMALDDVTAAGQQDLLIVQAADLGVLRDSDFSGATVTAMLIAAESGIVLASTTLRSGTGSAYARYEARTLGNLDGLGGPEWGIHVLDYPANPHTAEGAGLDPAEKWLLFGGSPGAEPLVVQATPDGTGDADTEATGDNTGRVAGGAGKDSVVAHDSGTPGGTDDTGDDRATPGLGAAGLMAVTVGIAFIARRRTR